MAAILIGSLTNMILDYLFLFPLNWGITGAALATGIAPLVSLCFVHLPLKKKQNEFYPVRTRPNRANFRSITVLGLPSLLTEVAAGIVMIAFNSLLLAQMGNTGVAACGIIANLALVATSIFTGIAQGSQPLLSRCYGSGHLEEGRKIFRLTLTGVVFLFS